VGPLELVDPLTLPGWDEMLSGWREATFFHTSHWVRVLREAYGYRPCYLASVENDHFKVLLPCMEVRSPFTGKRGVSLPFTDHCQPLLEDPKDCLELVERMVGRGREAGWRSIELRGVRALPPDIPASSTWYGHTLDLSRGEQALRKGLRESTRRNIRAAEKSGVQVTMETSAAALKGFYGLNCLTRKTHGLPPQPYHFFEKLHEHVLAKGHGMVAAARYEGMVIAASVFFNFRDKAVYKYGASDRRYQHLRANNLVMWEAIRWYARRGCQTLCFGRTEPENKGLLQFKRGWGAREETISYLKYDLRKSQFVTEQPKVTGFHNRVFRAMPLPLLRLAGELVYKHVG
jgi:hypothetical protein